MKTCDRKHLVQEALRGWRMLGTPSNVTGLLREALSSSSNRSSITTTFLKCSLNVLIHYWVPCDVLSTFHILSHLIVNLDTVGVSFIFLSV